MSNTEKATDIIAREIYVSAFTMQWSKAQGHVSDEEKKAYGESVREAWKNELVPPVIRFDFGEIALPIVTLLQQEGLLIEDTLENWERPSWL